MSKQRSGLLSGLIVALIAALLSATGVAALYWFYALFPESVTTFGEGVPIFVAVALLSGLFVGLAVRVVRPRSRLLPPLTGLLAAGGFLLGIVAGFAPFIYDSRDTHSAPDADHLPAMDSIANGFPQALSRAFQSLGDTWQLWAFAAIAAVVAFLLVALRVRRVRKTTAVPGVVEEPEYRAPFEPAQPTGDLFTPHKPVKD